MSVSLHGRRDGLPRRLHVDLGGARGSSELAKSEETSGTMKWGRLSS